MKENREETISRITYKETLSLCVAMYKLILPALAVAVASIFLLGAMLGAYL